MQINWDDWIENGGDPRWKPLRQAVHIVLLSISKCESLKDHMMLKGGILMALCYESSRFTRDIDFSQKAKYQEGDEAKLLGELSNAIKDSINEVDYGLDCSVQSSQLKPPSEKNPTFPTLNVKIGYAYNYDTKMHQRLIKGHSPTVLEIDFSFNETTKSAEEFSISEGHTLLRYSIIDLMAEKFRALLQQEKRNRYRGQDLYDLLFLIRRLPSQLQENKSEILQALIASSKSKDLNLTQESMSKGKTREMTKQEYDLLDSTVEAGTLVNFDVAYDEVTDFYKSLPWNIK